MEYGYPYASDLELGDFDPSFGRLRKTFPHRVSRAYELVARELVRGGRGPRRSFRRLGRWWDRNQEIDLVGLDPEGDRVLFGEVKWSAKLVGTNVYDELIEKAKHVTWGKGNREETYALFSKSGFTPDLRRLARTEPLFLFHKDRRVRGS